MQRFPDFSAMFLLQTLFLTIFILTAFFSHYDSTIIVPNLATGRKEAWKLEGNSPRCQHCWIDRHIEQLLLVATFFWLWNCKAHCTSSFPNWLPFLPRAQLGSLSRGLQLGWEVGHLHTGLPSSHALVSPKCFLLLPIPNPQKYLQNFVLNVHQTPTRVPQGSVLPAYPPSRRSVCQCMPTEQTHTVHQHFGTALL